MSCGRTGPRIESVGQVGGRAHKWEVNKINLFLQSDHGGPFLLEHSRHFASYRFVGHAGLQEVVGSEPLTKLREQF